MFEEADTVCDWAKTNSKERVIILIDTDNIKKVGLLKEKYEKFNNILITNHNDFQLYIMEKFSYKHLNLNKNFQEMNKKKELGQFYTTNYNYILQNMKIPTHEKNIIEPFAGNGDLLNFIGLNSYNIECYDIEPKQSYIIKRDTLLNPPSYDDKFILTNPPYLARNKNKNKELYNKYKCNDLYKCFLQNISSSNCNGGIIIVPLNFLCSIRKSDIYLRKLFFSKFRIIILNIFEEDVFKDTSYTVCCFQFQRKDSERKEDSNELKCMIYPSNKSINGLKLCEENDFTIGGEIYKLSKNKNYKIERATKKTKNEECITNILLKCIDDSIEKQIGLKMIRDEEKFIDKTEKLSARSYATLVISPKIDSVRQQELVDKFNLFMREKRQHYNSLFLTNYRENNRKRISFELAFRICSYLL